MAREIDTGWGGGHFVIYVTVRSLPLVSPSGVGFQDKAESYTLMDCTH